MEWKLNHNINLSELRALRKWYRKQPKLLQKATGMMLNNFAFGTRAQAVTQIGATMTVRNPTYVSSRLRVTKTSLSTPINSQRAIVGSIYGARFSGWIEQETGKATSRNRLGTIASRGGDVAKQMRPMNRLKPGTEVLHSGSDGYTPRGGEGNYGGFLAMLTRRKEKRLVKIKGGFYRVNKGANSAGVGPAMPLRHDSAPVNALQLIQEMKKKQPKRNRWLRRSRAIYFKQTDLRALWKLTLARLVVSPPKR